MGIWWAVFFKAKQSHKTRPMIIGFDNIGFRHAAHIIGIEISGFRIVTEDVGASRIIGFDDVGLRIIPVVTQGGD